MTDLTLWISPGTIALVSLIALEEAGAPYRAERLDFAVEAQKSDAYRRINPKARVPALVTARGILTETPAILTFIAESFPAARLLPADPFLRAKVQELCAYLCSTVHVSHAHLRRGARWSDDPVVIAALALKVPRNMTDHFAYLETRFGEAEGGPWAFGSDLTIADPYLFVLGGWLHRYGVEIAQFPRIAAHHARMAARPAVQRALAVEAGEA